MHVEYMLHSSRVPPPLALRERERMCVCSVHLWGKYCYTEDLTPNQLGFHRAEYLSFRFCICLNEFYIPQPYLRWEACELFVFV